MNNRWKFQCRGADNKAYRAVQILYVNCKLKAEFQWLTELLKVIVLCYWVAKNDESDGNKAFEVYSSYITVASNVFKQTKHGSVLWVIS